MSKLMRCDRCGDDVEAIDIDTVGTYLLCNECRDKPAPDPRDDQPFYPYGVEE